MADVGCGHGSSTIILAKEFPNSTFIGFDYHPDSIKTATQRAQEAGVSDRVSFQTADSAHRITSYNVCYTKLLRNK